MPYTLRAVELVNIVFVILGPRVPCKTKWSTSLHSLKYLRSTALGCKDIGIRKSEFVAKTQILYQVLQMKYIKVLKFISVDI